MNNIQYESLPLVTKSTEMVSQLDEQIKLLKDPITRALNKLEPIWRLFNIIIL